MHIVKITFPDFSRPFLNTFLISLLFFQILSCDKKPDRDDPEFIKEKISKTNLGLAYLDINDLENAEGAFKELLELDPKEAMAYANLGLVYLRLSQFEKAEDHLKEAFELDPANPEIKLILAELYHQTNRSENSISQLQEIIKDNPEFERAYFKLFNQLSEKEDSTLVSQSSEFLNKLVDLKPANIVPRMHLIKKSIIAGNSETALIHLEKLIEIVPVFPPRAINQLSEIKTQLQKNQPEKSLPAYGRFEGLMKATPYYIQDFDNIKGPEGKIIGYPVITTSQKISTNPTADLSLMDVIKFTDVSELTGLEKNNKKNIVSSAMAVADYDLDGDIDLYYSFVSEGKDQSEYFLYNSEMGSFEVVNSSAGLNHNGIERSATFADYDNDGFLDLFITLSDAVVLYKANGDGTFTNVTDRSGLSNSRGGNHALFADLDHDGDLDIYISGKDQNEFFRNNADGTFTDNAAAMNLQGEGLNAVKSDFADFDEDGDLDLFVVNENGKNLLLSNLRSSQFKNVTEKAGLSGIANSNAMAIGDYNNDGSQDIFVASDDKPNLFQNKLEFSFESDKSAEAEFDKLNMDIQDASFLDFDNDGFIDLLLCGIAEGETQSGIYLFRNDSLGNFKNVSQILPEGKYAAMKAEHADFNQDGDLDLFVSTSEGLKLFRNESDFINHYFKVQLFGLSYGNGKNNRYGIGSRVEILAGGQYQVQLVKKPVIHFGIGRTQQVDAMRIVWTNGVPQGVIEPRSKEDILEENSLKGSCPFLYTWNGEKYVFVKDMMWRSALGMPLGIMGDQTAYAFPDISKEYLKIPGEVLVPKDGKYSIRITEELWEAVFFDKAELIAVDHPDSIDFFVDERFVLPPFPGREIYNVRQKHIPSKAYDAEGNDLIPFISAHDDRYIANFNEDKYQGVTEAKELILDLGDKANTNDLYLFLRGWIFPTDASINVAMSQSENHKAITPYLQVINKNGDWETIIPNLGFPMGKDKTVVADLSGKFLSDDKRVKIVTNMQIYWDHIFFSENTPESPVKMTDLELLSADLHFRGYSALYRKGGQYGPHWFDYYDITKGQKWRDLTGNYTRYGDVKELLLQGDDKYIIANAGDEVSLEFDAMGLPDLPKGWKRDFLIYSEGWVKDGDLNTAYGMTVEPLPFRDMSSYPYGDDEHYPNDKEHQEYLKKYNTRVINTESFRNQLKQ